MYAPTKSLSARISQRLLLSIAVAGVMAMDIQMPTATHAATITQENAALQNPNSSTKTLPPTAKSSSAGSRKSHRLVRRPAPLGSSQTGAMSTATLNQAPLTPAISTVPAKTVSQEPGTTSTREGAADKQSPPVSFAAPIAGPLALMQTAPVTSAAAAPSALMGSAQPSTRVAAAAPSGARGPSLPGRMQRLLSELPGAAQIVAYQEEDPDPTVVIPTLTRNPSVLSFSAVQNGSSPAAQSLTIANTGPGTLTWTASSNSAWLTLNNATSASGTNLGSVSIRVNPAGLSVGTHSGLITIVGTGAANSPQIVTVSFDVTAAPTPTIGLSATTLSFSAVQGGSNPANKTISISNSGSGTLSWTATENANWLSLSPASGTGAGTISVAVNTSGLSVGTVSTPITIAASGATNTPQTVNVSLTITAAPVPPAIGVSPRSLSFTAQAGANPAAQTLIVSNTGGGTLSWSASDNATWLSVSPASGTGNSAVTASVTTGTLATGSYSGAITLSATGAASVTIPVALTITAAPVPPAIGLSPTSLSFTAQQGSSNPTAQSVTISNTGGGTLGWSVSHDATWLGHTPNTGTGAGTVTISVTTGTLAAGTYSGQVTLWPTGATPVILPVTFTVTAAPAITLAPSGLSYAATQGAANPANQNVSLTNSGGTLNWTVSDDAAWLTVSPTSGSGTRTLTTSVNTAGLSAGTYSATVTVSAAGASSKTVAITLTVNAPATSSATLTWNANTESDLAGYKIYRATTSGGYGAPIATLQGNITTYIAAGLQSGTTYFFVITSYDSAGNESPRSNEVSKSIF
ncbi:MAG: choice-of-anchor D domain-containing protein [Nitrospiraceae bacterium]|nr:choice-of-anchor D domain-containing protein [Nitrospiraceae bacterium]